MKGIDGERIAALAKAAKAAEARDAVALAEARATVEWDGDHFEGPFAYGHVYQHHDRTRGQWALKCWSKPVGGVHWDGWYSERALAIRVASDIASGVVEFIHSKEQARE